MIKDDLLKKYEVYWQHYKLQNDSMEKVRNFFWLIQAALFVSWYKVNCSGLKFFIIIFGLILSLSCAVVFFRFRKAINLTVDSLVQYEKYMPCILPDIFRNERAKLGGKRFLSQEIWMDKLHPALFCLAWLVLLYFYIRLCL